MTRETDAFLATRLGMGGQTLGIFAGDDLVAYGILGLPSDPKSALIGPAEPDPPPVAAVGVLDGGGVAVAWRGFGLHGVLCRRRLELARGHGRPWLRATAAPANHASWRNLLAVDLRVVALAPMYEGSWRYLMATPHRPASSPGTAQRRTVAAADLGSQARLLAAGWTGVAAVVLDGRPAITFAPPDSTRP